MRVGSKKYYVNYESRGGRSEGSQRWRKAMPTRAKCAVSRWPRRPALTTFATVVGSSSINLPSVMSLGSAVNSRCAFLLHDSRQRRDTYRRGARVVSQAGAVAYKTAASRCQPGAIRQTGGVRLFRPHLSKCKSPCPSGARREECEMVVLAFFSGVVIGGICWTGSWLALAAWLESRRGRRWVDPRRPGQRWSGSYRL